MEAEVATILGGGVFFPRDHDSFRWLGRASQIETTVPSSCEGRCVVRGGGVNRLSRANKQD